MEYTIVTGMSGAGKSTALNILEDMGYYCVDNLPIPMLHEFIDMMDHDPDHARITRAAIGIDIRSGNALADIDSILRSCKESGTKIQVFFLDASDECLIKRYKETRRRHPLDDEGGLEKGIRAERSKLEFLRKNADFCMDTSMLLTRELQQELDKIFRKGASFNSLYITIASFGFKFGVPADADLVFDVRFLPNPYYVDSLRKLTGNDKEVRDYCLNNEVGREFMERLISMIRFMIPNYVAEGRSQLVICIGCTGGRHRSVAVANELFENLDGGDYGLRIEHRTAWKDKSRKDEAASDKMEEIS